MLRVLFLIIPSIKKLTLSYCTNKKKVQALFEKSQFENSK